MIMPNAEYIIPFFTLTFKPFRVSVQTPMINNKTIATITATLTNSRIASTFRSKIIGKDELKERANRLLEENRQELTKAQELLYANNTYAMRVILQGMDAAGKDSTIKHVMSGVNPQGCRVTSFKQPSTIELHHDFMWRQIVALPEKGMIGIFNRSYYEEVLVVRVHQNLLENQNLPTRKYNDKFWQDRYEDIANFEHYLVRNGTLILKFFLHISKSEQKNVLSNG